MTQEHGQPQNPWDQRDPGAPRYTVLLDGGPCDGRRFKSFPRAPDGEYQGEIRMATRQGHRVYVLTARRKGKVVIYEYAGDDDDS